MCNTTMDPTFYKQQCVTGISLRVFEIPQSLNTRSPTHTSSASVVANNGFWFFCFYLYLFNIPNSIHFDYLATLWMVLNWYPGVVKSLRLRKIICTVVLISETLRKKYWIWTVINGQMLVSQCEKEVGD